MKTSVSNKAQIPNPALQQFNILVGEWKTTGKHPLVPHKTLEGKSFFNWIEGGAFLRGILHLTMIASRMALQFLAAMMQPANSS